MSVEILRRRNGHGVPRARPASPSRGRISSDAKTATDLSLSVKVRECFGSLSPRSRPRLPRHAPASHRCARPLAERCAQRGASPPSRVLRAARRTPCRETSPPCPRLWGRIDLNASCATYATTSKVMRRDSALSRRTGPRMRNVEAPATVAFHLHRWPQHGARVVARGRLRRRTTTVSVANTRTAERRTQKDHRTRKCAQAPERRQHQD